MGTKPGPLTKPKNQKQNIQKIEQVKKSLDVFTLEKFVGRLLNCQNEKQIVELALNTVFQSTTVTGASFLPFNEWAQVLSPVLLGEVPNEEIFSIQAYAEQVELRQKCKACGVNVKDRDCMLLPAKGQFRIVCRKLSTGDHNVGVANYYFPISGHLPDNEIQVIEKVMEYSGKYLRSILRTGISPTTVKAPSDGTDQLSRSYARSLIGANFHQLQQSDEGIVAGLDLAPGLDSTFYGMTTSYGDWEKLLGLAIITMGSGQTDIETNNQFVSEVAFAISLPGKPQPVAAVWAKTISDRGITPHSIRWIKSIAQMVELTLQNEMESHSLIGRAILQERERLAREIHDGFAQTLAFLLIQMKRIEGFEQQGDHAKFASAFEETHQTIQDAYVDIREAIENLRAGSKSPFGMMIKDVVSSFCKKSKIQCEVKIDQPDKEINEFSAVHVIRIIQEALTNSRKHANATIVAVRGFNTENHFVVEVEDDGKGMRLDPEGSFGKYGLRSMRERAELIGATLLITSDPNKGTKIELHL